jgi:hypothetical protein
MISMQARLGRRGCSHSYGVMIAIAHLCFLQLLDDLLLLYGLLFCQLTCIGGRASNRQPLSRAEGSPYVFPACELEQRGASWRGRNEIFEPYLRKVHKPSLGALAGWAWPLCRVCGRARRGVGILRGGGIRGNIHPPWIFVLTFGEAASHLVRQSARSGSGRAGARQKGRYCRF